MAEGMAKKKLKSQIVGSEAVCIYNLDSCFAGFFFFNFYTVSLNLNSWFLGSVPYLERPSPPQ